MNSQQKKYSRMLDTKKSWLIGVLVVAMILLKGVFLCAQEVKVSGSDKKTSLDTMIGQLIMVGFRGADPIQDAKLIAFVKEDIRNGNVGGVILFDHDMITATKGRNIRSVKQVRVLTDSLQAEALIPLFVGVDQEGGRVRRFKEEHGVPATPSAAELGRASLETTLRAAEKLGEALSQAGVTVNFAPSVDVNVTPNCPIIGALDRSFSSSADRVTAHAEAFARGLKKYNIISTYKHFPGHGSSVKDSHYSLTDVTETWKIEELTPYCDLTPDAFAMVMVGHVINRNIDPVLPATLSKKAITGVLRKDLGWQGVVITDDMEMTAIQAGYDRKEAIALALNAGVDIVLFGNNLSYDPFIGRTVHGLIMELVNEGIVSESRIRESYERIVTLKKRVK